MYSKRIKIFVILSAALLLICVLRLAQMQLLSDSLLQERIAELKLQRGRYRQLKTVRGKILDRKAAVLAMDEPRFYLCISYELGCLADERVSRYGLSGQIYDTQPEDLDRIIEKCAQLGGLAASDIRNEIQKINNFIWQRRAFQAWRNNFPNSEVIEKYDSIIGIPLSEAVADFERKQPDAARRLELVNKVDIVEMHKSWPLLELKTDDDIFTAQLEFMDIDGIVILPKAHRVYPYGPVAAQTIGWVGPASRQADRRLFADDRLLCYLDDEVCGREDGVEYVCETVLRGRRGEEIYDIDRRLVSRTDSRFGKDVTLTLDIELQKKIEEYLTDCAVNANCKAPMAVVVIDVASGDILSLVSMPTFDLNTIRQTYTAVAADPNEPLRNRAINKQYPPGSVVKPLILVAGLESGKITPREVIGCPPQKAPPGWPSCWIYNRYRLGHDNNWPNYARNAVKGSCNIYFSRLADRIEPRQLQQWLFDFGYGHKIPLAAALHATSNEQRATSIKHRDLRQAQGQISNVLPEDMISDFNQAPPLDRVERRYFGIGQGNLRATPLQVANAMVAIARGGVLKQPRLFKEIQNSKGTSLGISAETLKVVYDGMSAVVSEPGGTAYKEFAYAGLAGQGVEVYGKTGSTERPGNAWFAGFAEDSASRGIAIAVVVEGGQHGSSDASPLARDIIQFCIEAGYLGDRD